MNTSSVNLSDLPPDVQRTIRQRTGKTRLTRVRDFTAEHERRHALRVCALIADLTQDQRARVLRRAQKINEA